MFDQLVGANVFSQLELATKFHQLRIAEDNTRKTVFRILDGLYEWLVIPFGLTNAPTYFVDLMSQVFRGLLNKFVVVFVDEILVYSKSECMMHLKVVLNSFCEHS